MNNDGNDKRFQRCKVPINGFALKKKKENRYKGDITLTTINKKISGIKRHNFVNLKDVVSFWHEWDKEWEQLS